MRGVTLKDVAAFARYSCRWCWGSGFLPSSAKICACASRRFTAQAVTAGRCVQVHHAGITDHYWVVGAEPENIADRRAQLADWASRGFDLSTNDRALLRRAA